MPSASLREMSSHRRPKFGTYVIEFDTPGMGHICKTAT